MLIKKGFREVVIMEATTGKLLIVTTKSLDILVQYLPRATYQARFSILDSSLQALLINPTVTFCFVLAV